MDNVRVAHVSRIGNATVRIKWTDGGTTTVTLSGATETSVDRIFRIIAGSIDAPVMPRKHVPFFECNPSQCADHRQ